MIATEKPAPYGVLLQEISFIGNFLMKNGKTGMRCSSARQVPTEMVLSISCHPWRALILREVLLLWNRESFGAGAHFAVGAGCSIIRSSTRKDDDKRTGCTGGPVTSCLGR